MSRAEAFPVPAAPKDADPARAWRVRRPLTLGVVGLLVVLGGFGGWAATSSIAGAIVASGQVAVENNRQVVQHPDGGIVAEVAVREGDVVEAGAPMIRLDAAELATEADLLASQLADLDARAARLEAERDAAPEMVLPPDLAEAADGDPSVAAIVAGQRRLFEAARETRLRQVEQLRRRQDQITSQIEGVRAQQIALTEQLDLFEEELADQSSLLERGLTQAPRVLSLRRERAGLLGQVGELAATVSDLEGRRTEIDIQILRLRDETRQAAITELRDLRARAVEVAAQLSTARTRLSRLVIAAPVAGVVYDLQVFGPGAVVRTAEPVAYVVPRDRPLVIQARIQPTDVDQVWPGQSAVLRLPGFDARTTPELMATVVRLSPDAFVDEATGAAFYDVELLPDAGEMARLPEGTDLLPGMPVEAFIRTTDRTPLAFLVKPLTDYFTRAFREGE